MLASLGLVVVGCEPQQYAKRPEAEAPPEEEDGGMPEGSVQPPGRRVARVEFEPDWRSLTFGAYLLPKQDFADESGGVDVIFHFHGYQDTAKQWRATGINALVVGCTLGVGDKAYSEAFGSPDRFGKMVDELLGSVRSAKSLRALHPRRLGLVSFGPGYGAIGRILAQQRWFELVDTVILLDGLHADYTHEHTPDISALHSFLRFAGEAAGRKKLMVMTHSGIRRSDGAPSSETIAAILEILIVRKVEKIHKNQRGMLQQYEANEGDLHVRGYAGTAPKDHTDQLMSIGEILDDYVVPRWSKV
jgi:hypothetical protein